MIDDTTPVTRANARGHEVENDGPTLGGASRWTCRRCGRAVLRYANNVYGSAVDEDCVIPADAKDS